MESTWFKMNGYYFFTIPPHFKDIVTLIGVMHVDFSSSGISPIYRFPWMNHTHIFFPLQDEPLKVRKEGDDQFHFHSNSYFVGPKLLNEIADFGKERHVLGITFKPGVFQRLLGIPGKEVTNIDIDATYIFGNSIRETEMKLREAKNNAEILVIVEQFLCGLMRSIRDETPFDAAVTEMIHHNGNLSVETFANYACKSIRQFERLSLEKIGMSPRLFNRLLRFGKAFSIKETSTLTWTEIAHRVGYYDQMHLIRDFKTFMGTTPGSLNLSSDSSVKMIAALHGQL